MTWRDVAAACGLALVMAALQLGCSRGSGAMTELQHIKAGELDVVLLSPHDALQHGQDTFILEFRINGNLVDVGEVRASATMPMPALPMFGSVDVQKTGVKGRYDVSSRFEMAGTWRMNVEWGGQGGREAASASFSALVR